MSDDNNEKTSAIPPIKLGKLKIFKPAKYAAGIKGITTSISHLSKEMGILKGLNILKSMNQKSGFDCPGCAWPDPDDKRSVLGEYCENGAKALAEEATLKRVAPVFFKQNSIKEIATWSDYKIGKSGRLTHPMVKKIGSKHYEAISWTNAFEKIAAKLKSLTDPNEAVFYTSGRSSNEAAFLYGLFARAFGTNNLPDCSNMCHESSGIALSQTLGIAKGSVTLNDFNHAEVVIIIGQNPGTNHPRMLSALEKTKKNGGKIITINPLEEAGLKRFVNPQDPIDIIKGGTVLTDLFLQVKINEDVSLLKVIMKKLLLLSKDDPTILDLEFVQNQTNGFEVLRQVINNYSIGQLVQQCGVPEKHIDEAVNIIKSRKRIIICWAMGLTQHKNGVANIKECVNLLLLKGAIGKKGAGTCPVRGHSNVQGDRTVGIMHQVKPEFNQKIKEVFGFESPNKPGLDTVASIKAMYQGRAKVFVALGGNFVSAASDTNYTAQAIQNCDLTVSISTKLNRTHTITGKESIILPTLGRSEKDIKNGNSRKLSVENSMGKVHSTQGKLNPASNYLMSEPDIIGNIAAATLGSDHPVSWIELSRNYSSIRTKIAQVIHGFENYENKIDQGKEFYLPNNARAADFSQLPNGRAQFSINPLPNHKLKSDEFLLMTIRSHDQFNTTIYGLDDRYRGVFGERRVLFMNQSDMDIKGLKIKDLVDIASHYSGITRIAKSFYVIPYYIPSQNLAAYFPETNVLVPIDEFADQSRTPISKSIKVKILKH